MTPRQRIMQAASDMLERSSKGEPSRTEFDEETGMVTIFVDGQPRYMMHVTVYAELEEKFAAESRGTDGS